MSCIRVASFNLKHDSVFARRNRWQVRRELVRQVIEQTRPAILGVQELMPAMREDLRRLLADYSAFGFGRSRNLSGEESAILVSSGNRVCSDSTFWLSRHPSRQGSRAFFAVFPRICTVCEVDLEGIGQRIRVFNTHLDHICGPARTLGARTILQVMHRLNQKEQLPCILMGDMNTGPDSYPIQLLSNNLHQYPDIRLHNLYESLGADEIFGTYHGFKGRTDRAPIDYIFYSDEFTVERAYIDTTSLEGQYPSDHFPLVAELNLR